VELTELIRDYVATELLSSIEIDFLEGELWETTQHIAEINTVIKAPKNICKKLGLDENSCWQLCCAAVLDYSRPLKNGQNRVDDFKKLMDNLKEINCKEIFKKAYENRYSWKNDFRGYQGKCIFLTKNNIHKGDFVLGKDFKTNIQKIEDEKVVKSIASQLFEVSIHRVKRKFESVHSENNFNFLKKSENGIEMSVSGKNQGDKYRVKNNYIYMV